MTAFIFVRYDFDLDCSQTIFAYRNLIGKSFPIDFEKIVSIIYQLPVIICNFEKISLDIFSEIFRRRRFRSINISGSISYNLIIFWNRLIPISKPFKMQSDSIITPYRFIEQFIIIIICPETIGFIRRIDNGYPFEVIIRKIFYIIGVIDQVILTLVFVNKKDIFILSIFRLIQTSQQFV